MSEWLRFNVYNGGADENLFSPADLDPRIPGYVGHALSKTREDALTSGLRGDGRGIAILVRRHVPQQVFCKMNQKSPTSPHISESAPPPPSFLFLSSLHAVRSVASRYIP